MPNPFADGFRSRDNSITAGLIVGENPGDVPTEGDHAGTGQCGHINNPSRLQVGHDVEHVGQYDPPLSIGIVNFDCGAAAGGNDIPQLVGGCTIHIFHQADRCDHIDRQFEGRNRGDRPEGGGRARHVALHRQHAVRGFE